MARLLSKTAAGHRKVYDVTVDDTHSFFVFSAHAPEHGILVHNCHELSRQAMDAMLLPMEESWPGSEDRKMVCIFCTTELEKMRPAILSRCAPVFRIRPNTPQQIADRLAEVCGVESIPFEPEALVLIAEATECHIRDCYKALEGISLVGPVDVSATRSYLQLDVTDLFENLLEALGGDLPTLLSLGEAVLARVSAMTAYERLAEMAMATYRRSLGHTGGIPSYWNRERIEALGESMGPFLLRVVHVLTSRPPQFSSSTFLCDLALLHQERHGVGLVASVAVPRVVPLKPLTEPGKVQQPSVTEGGVFVHPNAKNATATNTPAAASVPKRPDLTPASFQRFLLQRFQELSEELNGQEGSAHVGRA